MLEVGKRVRVTHAVDLGLDCIAVGETGVISAQYFDKTWGDETWITLDQRHPELDHYGNAMWLDHREHALADVLTVITADKCRQNVVRQIVFAVIYVARKLLTNWDDHNGSTSGDGHNGSTHHVSDINGQHPAPPPYARSKLSQPDGGHQTHDAPTVHANFSIGLPVPRKVGG